MSRVQLALNVPDIDEAVDFYSKLFATDPNKRQPGYANFAIADPPLKLVLFENRRRRRAAQPPRRRGDDRPTRSPRTRPASTGEGVATVDESGTCCYAKQEKVWVDGPDGVVGDLHGARGQRHVRPVVGTRRGRGSDSLLRQRAGVSRALLLIGARDRRHPARGDTLPHAAVVARQPPLLQLRAALRRGEHPPRTAARVERRSRRAPATGFSTHSHRDMEIVTWVLSGQLEHRDSEGNHGVLYPGLAQRMSVGTGIAHSEVNPSDTEPVHFVQMWVPPDTPNLAPSYEQRDVNDALASGGLQPVASGQGHDGAIAIHQRDAVAVGRPARTERAGGDPERGARPRLRRAWRRRARGRRAGRG